MTSQEVCCLEGCNKHRFKNSIYCSYEHAIVARDSSQ